MSSLPNTPAVVRVCHHKSRFIFLAFLLRGQPENDAELNPLPLFQIAAAAARTGRG